MALKDLTVEKGALDEAAIERIVGPYVRYDLEAKEITFMPAFAGLSNKAKILVYLVAIQGWKFVADEPMASDARPADIEAATDIPGGSLRPTLRGLCESHVLAERDSRYSVRGSNFPLIEAELNGGNDVAVVPRARRVPHKTDRKSQETAEVGEVAAEFEADDEPVAREAGEKRSRKVGVKTRSIAATFDRWIDSGWFDKPRTLSDVHKHFRKVGIMIPQTSLSGRLLSAVHNERLSRDEVEVNGKTVWAYTATKAMK